MQKKLMAVAVAGALGAPAAALAQTATVQMYGTVVLNYNYVDSGPRAGAHTRTDMMNAHDANIGFRGEEKLGGGLSAWFQCESSLDLTGEDSAGNGFCARNSGIGLKGAFGNIFLGIWDTPMKLVAAPARPFSTSGIYGMGSLLWNESGSNVGNVLVVDGVTIGNATSFTRRQNNTVNWHSPVWNGFQVLAAFSSADEATRGADVPNTLSKPRLWSVGASYSSGPLYLAAGYERHKNYNPGGPAGTALAAYAATGGGDDSGWNILGSYQIGPFKASLYFTRLKYENTNGAGASLKTNNWAVYGDWRIQGPHTLRLGYTVAGDGKGTPGGANVNSIAAPTAAGVTDSGAKLFGVQYAYAFSKRTEINLGFARLDNESRSRHRLQTAGPRNAGQDQDAWQVGFRHRF
ncbi:MAG TPA: porin [Burkholderiales bacterium]|nr:porin [Burkholderiales bacterium]